jgi:hypothetical protein
LLMRVLFVVGELRRNLHAKRTNGVLAPARWLRARNNRLIRFSKGKRVQRGRGGSRGGAYEPTPEPSSWPQIMRSKCLGVISRRG